MPIATREELLARVQQAAPITAILQETADFLAGDVFLVGGTVRDLLLGRPFTDVDLAVDGDVLRYATAIGAPDGVESRFGTLTLNRPEARYDLARTRSERYPRPGSLPEVEPAPIDADLLRRDFRVNAIALGLRGSREGELIAVDGALEDLSQRRLSVLHDNSFEDDPTRLLRLARYAARLQFSAAPHTRELAHQAVSSGALETVSGTRIGNELRLLAKESDPIRAFDAAASLGLPWSLNADLAKRALAALPRDGRSDIVLLSCAFAHHHPRAQLASDLDRLGFSAADRDAIVEAAGASGLAERLSKTTSNSEIAREVGTAGIETVALASAQGSPSQSLAWLRTLRHLRLQITGDDLRTNGLQEGPAIGKALAIARDALMDGTAPDRANQLAVALKAAQ